MIGTDVILTMTGHMTVEITMIETMETTQTIISVDAGVGDVADRDAEAIRHQMMMEMDLTVTDDGILMIV